MTSKLSVFNGALRLCKERRLTSLTENREPRRLLDEAWEDGSTGGAVKACLEMGQWEFARRTVQLNSSAILEPEFGYTYAFEKPDDFVRVCGVWQDEYCETPLLRYQVERGVWFADIDPIYISYVSNGETYGADLSLWPEVFVKLVQAELAMEIVGNLTQSRGLRADVQAIHKQAKLEAKSFDAQELPTSFPPPGKWSMARTNGYRRNYRDRLGGSLIS